MSIRDSVGAVVRRFADIIGPPAFPGTPFPTGGVDRPQQLTEELGGTGTWNFGGYIRGEDFNPQMDGQTAIKNLDEMRRSDSQVHAALEVVKLPIRTAGYEVDPSDPSDPKAVEVAKFVEWCLFKGMVTTWDDVIRQALLMLDFGFMLFEKVWTVAEDGPYAGRLVLHKLAARPPRTIWQWFTDDDGSLISIKQLAVKAGNYQFLDIPSTKLVRFTFQQEGDNFTGISMLRSAYPHWLIKKQLYLIDAIRATRYGVGIPRAKLKPGYKPSEDDRNAIATMLQGLSSHQHAYLIQPEQMEVDILMPQGVRGGVEILDSINHQNEQITRNILAQFLDMGGSSTGGSRALGASAMDFFLNAIESIANQICDVLNKQLIKDLVDMNFQVSEYPTLRATGINETDVAAVAAAATQLTTAGLMSPGDRKTENTFRKLLNMPEVSEVAPAPGQPGMPPGAPIPPGMPTTPAQTLANTTAVGGVHPAATTVATPTAGLTTVATPMPANTIVSQITEARKAPNPQRAELETEYVHAAAPPLPPNPPPPVPAPTYVGPSVVPPSPEAPRERTEPAIPATTQVMPAIMAPTVDTALPADTIVRAVVPARTVMLPSGPTDGEEHPTTHVSASERQPSAAAYQTLWRDPTPLEARVLELREIPNRLDTAREKLLITLQGVRAEQISRIATSVARSKPGEQIKPPLIGKMASVLKIQMNDVFEYGHQQVVNELKKQGLHTAGAITLSDLEDDATFGQ